MEHLIEGTITKSYQELNKEKEITFSFPVKGYGITVGSLSLLRRIYKKSFIYDFYKVLTSKVE